jgi:hypothetical protein
MAGTMPGKAGIHTDFFLIWIPHRPVLVERGQAERSRCRPGLEPGDPVGRQTAICAERGPWGA